MDLLKLKDASLVTKSVNISRFSSFPISIMLWFFHASLEKLCFRKLSSHLASNCLCDFAKRFCLNFFWTWFQEVRKQTRKRAKGTHDSVKSCLQTEWGNIWIVKRSSRNIIHDTVLGSSWYSLYFPPQRREKWIHFTRQKKANQAFEVYF